MFHMVSQHRHVYAAAVHACRFCMPGSPLTARRLLLEPLAQVDEAASRTGAPLPPVLLLLDALDEADHNGQGWLPVARLVATL